MSARDQTQKMGTVYGVGVGPGDPELITLKTARILRSVPVIFTPKADGASNSVALEIVKDIIDTSSQKVIFASFPIGMGKPREEAWDAAVEEIAGYIRTGSDVAFLTEGDPLLYGSFAYIAARMQSRHPDIPIDIVPGVTSVTAAAARAQIPLVSHGQRLAIWPAMYGVEDLRDALDDYDTIVLMKVNAQALEVVAKLEQEGCLSRAVLVTHATTSREKIVYDLRDISPDDAEYFSLMVISKNHQS